MTDPTDGRLLERWRTGDQAAFAVLVRRHESSLLRLARGLLAAGRGHEDVVQETFLKLAKKPPELPPEARDDPDAEHAQLAAWLHTVTRNLCMDTMRSETRRRRRESDVAPREHEAVDDGGLADVEARETREAVERSLERLPDDQREVLVLRLLGNKSYAEIADLTGRKVGTVGWLISVGVKALSRELAPLIGGAAADGRGIGVEA